MISKKFCFLKSNKKITITFDMNTTYAIIINSYRSQRKTLCINDSRIIQGKNMAYTFKHELNIYYYIALTAILALERIHDAA